MRPLRLLLLVPLCGCAAAPVDHTTTIAAFAGTVTWEAHLDRPHATYTTAASLRLLQCDDRACGELREGGAGSTAPDITVIAPDGGENTRLLQLLRTAGDANDEARHIAFQHPRLGCVEDSAAWVAGAQGPELHIVWHRATVQAEFVLHRVEAANEPLSPASAIALATSAPPPPAPAALPPRFRTLAPGVHEITLPDVDTRSLAIEFADHVVLCETSLDNAAGERLLACIDAHLPGKPVRYVLFGHYHPHYTGGLRPVMARGATVVAPPLGAAFAREIAERPFRSPPDALAASGITPPIETFRGERTFRDDANELHAIDIGSDSHHTVEYVVFWLPRQQMLFEGDLGWFVGDKGLRAGGNRARGLLQAIDDRKLPVVTLIQSWPTAGSSTLPLAELRALLAR